MSDLGLQFHLEKRGEAWVVVDGSGVSPATYISEELWLALQECQAENRRLREEKANTEGIADAVAGDMERMRHELQRLRWFYENMRDVDRRQLQVEYEEEIGNG